MLQDGPSRRSALSRNLKEACSDLLRRSIDEHGRVGERACRTSTSALTGDLAEDLHRLRDVSTPGADRASTTCRASLRERYVGQNGKWLLRIFAKDCLWDFEPLEHFVAQVRTVDPEATGKPFSTVEGLKAMKNGFQWAGIYALIVIVLVLLARFPQRQAHAARAAAAWRWA